MHEVGPMHPWLLEERKMILPGTGSLHPLQRGHLGKQIEKISLHGEMLSQIVRPQDPEVGDLPHVNDIQLGGETFGGRDLRNRGLGNISQHVDQALSFGHGRESARTCRCAGIVILTLTISQRRTVNSIEANSLSSSAARVGLVARITTRRSARLRVEFALMRARRANLSPKDWIAWYDDSEELHSCWKWAKYAANWPVFGGAKLGGRGQRFWRMASFKGCESGEPEKTGDRSNGFPTVVAMVRYRGSTRAGLCECQKGGCLWRRGCFVAQ